MKKFGKKIPCRVCGIEKPRTEYYRSHLLKSQRDCKQCMNARVLESKKRTGKDYRGGAQARRKKLGYSDFPEMILCRICGITKPREDFVLSMLRNYNKECKVCHSCRVNKKPLPHVPLKLPDWGSLRED